MKNIHVIATDKPSKIGYHTDIVKEGRLDYAPNFGFSEFNKERNFQHRPHNIYITSDEEIKIGDWYLNGVIPTNERINKSRGTNVASFYKSNDVKKIILTTDQELILDGVQPIDDEFLEWFVQNPSCEEVKVEKDEFYSKKAFIEGKDAITYTYKIIIPKEEPCDNCNNEICCCIIRTQETLEQLKKRVEGMFVSRQFRDGAEYGITEGAKWQQEQDKNKYSEEEVRRIAEWSFHFHKTNDYSDSELADEWELRLEKMFKNKNK